MPKIKNIKALNSITLNLTIVAQNLDKYKKIRLITKSEVINASADSVWKILGPGFHKVGTWLKGIHHSEGFGDPKIEGAVCNSRSCEVDFPGITEIREEILTYSDEMRELSYTATSGLPSFVVYNTNQWNIIPLGPNKCIAVTDATLHLKKFMGFLVGGSMEKSFKTALAEVMSELKAYAETGQLSKAKVEELNKKKK